MKKSIILLFICVCVCCISSCVSNKKITIKGTPGTEVFLPVPPSKNNKTDGGRALGELLAVIGDDGEVKIKLSKPYSYYPYLLTYNAETDRLYPVVLDYKRNKHTAEKNMGIILSIPTLCYYWVINDFRYYSSPQYRHSFDYIEELTINPNRPNAPYANTGERRKVKSGKASLLKSSGAAKTSKLLSKDYARQLEGSYKGVGKLLQDESVVENYSSMTVQMTYVDRNSVAVSVLMDDSEEVLSAVNYTIKSQGEGQFILTSEKDKSATIEVNGNKVSYNNPNVNIDGETYILQISVQ